MADGTERVIGTFNEDFIKRQAADLVKNNVPNYAFVSEFVKGLRKLPVGNFVAFPAEILRTGTNIVDTALDEIFFTANINGKIVNPLRSRGLQKTRWNGIYNRSITIIFSFRIPSFIRCEQR